MNQLRIEKFLIKLDKLRGEHYHEAGEEELFKTEE